MLKRFITIQVPACAHLFYICIFALYRILVAVVIYLLVSALFFVHLFNLFFDTSICPSWIMVATHFVHAHIIVHLLVSTQTLIKHFKQVFSKLIFYSTVRKNQLLLIVGKLVVQQQCISANKPLARINA